MFIALINVTHQCIHCFLHNLYHLTSHRVSGVTIQHFVQGHSYEHMINTNVWTTDALVLMKTWPLFRMPPQTQCEGR